MLPRILMALAVILLPGTSATASAQPSELPPLRTVAQVDLSRYLGRWYEIARLPNSFQKKCLNSRADYALRDDGDITVLNSCQDTQDGRLRQSKGRAWVVDPATNARLKVSFFWPFRGDYWIIELGNEYEYAVVGTPNRRYFWILSREQTMDSSLYEAILQRAGQQGFDTGAVLKAE
jgi:apolipoprotein D and lipocalin family protein